MARTNPTRATFLAKTEPETYSFDDLLREGKTPWNGVRNAQARNNLRAMQRGDRVLIYHSGKSREIVGIAEVVRPAYAEPGAEQWCAVDVKPVRRLKRPITLAEMRAIAELADWALMRHSRLSVVPMTAQQRDCVLALENA